MTDTRATWGEAEEEAEGEREKESLVLLVLLLLLLMLLLSLLLFCPPPWKAASRRCRTCKHTHIQIYTRTSYHSLVAKWRMCIHP